MSRAARWFWLLVFPALLAALAASAWIAWLVWPREVPPAPAARLPVPRYSASQLRVEGARSAVLGQVENFRDELLAYLNFEYIRSLRMVDSSRVLLTSVETPSGPDYWILIALDRDLLTAVPYLAQLKAQGYIGDFALDFVDSRILWRLRQQTELFESAYNMPVRQKLETLEPAQLLSPLARFILFKSKTDGRVRAGIQPGPVPLSLRQAHRLAADVIAVAQFYSLPLDFFLGIGAMENNYMDVNGDLEHTVWKRRPAQGDIVLKRRRGRVMVLDDSMGVWQITRETLRYAHKLYLRDKRDYSLLPDRLVPPRVLDVNSLTPDVLTTYAGLLFRDLLDKFGGDVEKAVAAYNGGTANPNMKYAEGVRQVAEYARKILERAALLNGRAVARTQFLMDARPGRG